MEELTTQDILRTIQEAKDKGELHSAFEALRFNLRRVLLPIIEEAPTLLSELPGQVSPELCTEASRISNLLLAIFYINIDRLDTALPILEEVLSSAELIQDQWTAFALRAMAYTKKEKGDIPGAFEYITHALEVAKIAKASIEIADCLVFLGRLNFTIGKKPEAIELFIKASLIYQEYKRDLFLNDVYYDIYMLYSSLGQHERALEYGMTNLENRLTFSGDKDVSYYSSLAVDYNNIGDTYIRLEDFDKAREYLLACLDIRQSKLPHETGALVLHNLAVLERKAGNLSKAKEYILASNEACKNSKEGDLSLSDPEGVPIILWNIVEEANLSLEMGEAEKSIELFSKVIETQSDWQEKQELCRVVASSLADAYRKTGQLEEYIRYMEIKHAQEICSLQKAAEVRFRNMEVAHQAEEKILKLEQEKQRAAIENEFIRKKNDELQRLYDEISHQKQLLEEANNRLQHLNEQKNEFLSIAAHDLKNPLHSIKMIADIILSSPDMTSDEVHDLTSDILKTSEQMFSLILDLLDINRIEEGTYAHDTAPVELRHVLESSAATYKARADEKGITIEADIACPDAIMLGDYAVVRQIADNILSNAIKYSPHNTTVTVSVFKNNKMVGFVISDQGPGFTQEDKAKMFSRFQRLSARPTGGEHSTGLGLSIVKKLVELFQGSIECISEEGKGSSFVISFPEYVASDVADELESNIV